MKNKQFCPVCNGAGRVVDAKTKKPRDCVLCGGKVERQILKKIPYAPTYEYSEDKFGVTVEQVAKIKYWLSFGITEQHLSNLYWLANDKEWKDKYKAVLIDKHSFPQHKELFESLVKIFNE